MSGPTPPRPDRAALLLQAHWRTPNDLATQLYALAVSQARPEPPAPPRSSAPIRRVYSEVASALGVLDPSRAGPRPAAPASAPGRPGPEPTRKPAVNPEGVLRALSEVFGSSGGAPRPDPAPGQPPPRFSTEPAGFAPGPTRPPDDTPPLRVPSPTELRGPDPYRGQPPSAVSVTPSGPRPPGFSAKGEFPAPPAPLMFGPGQPVGESDITPVVPPGRSPYDAPREWALERLTHIPRGRQVFVPLPGKIKESLGGGRYKVTVFRDGPDTDGNPYGIEVETEDVTVKFLGGGAVSGSDFDWRPQDQDEWVSPVLEFSDPDPAGNPDGSKPNKYYYVVPHTAGMVKATTGIPAGGSATCEILDLSGSPTGKNVLVHNRGPAVAAGKEVQYLVIRGRKFAVQGAGSAGSDGNPARCDCPEDTYEVAVDCGDCKGTSDSRRKMPKYWVLKVTAATQNFDAGCALECADLVGQGVRLKNETSGGSPTCVWSGSLCFAAELKVVGSQWQITVTDTSGCVLAVLVKDVADFDCCGANSGWTTLGGSSCDLTVSLEPDPCTCCAQESVPCSPPGNWSTSGLVNVTVGNSPYAVSFARVNDSGACGMLPDCSAVTISTTFQAQNTFCIKCDKGADVTLKIVHPYVEFGNSLQIGVATATTGATCPSPPFNVSAVSPGPQPACGSIGSYTTQQTKRLPPGVYIIAVQGVLEAHRCGDPKPTVNFSVGIECVQ